MRMREADSRRMQEVTPQREGLPSVERVTENRMTDRSQMGPDLVHHAGGDLHPKQGVGIAEPLQWVVSRTGDSSSAPCRRDSDLAAVRWIVLQR